MEITYLGSENEMVANAALFSPLADELLGGAVLVVACGVDEVAALLPESVEQLEAGFLRHVAHADLGPGRLADAHASELERRDVNASARGELTEVAELRGGLFGGGEESHFECRIEGELGSKQVKLWNWELGLFVDSLQRIPLTLYTPDDSFPKATR